jgi:hypothetical protein
MSASLNDYEFLVSELQKALEKSNLENGDLKNVIRFLRERDSKMENELNELSIVVEKQTEALLLGTIENNLLSNEISALKEQNASLEAALDLSAKIETKMVTDMDMDMEMDNDIKICINILTDTKPNPVKVESLYQFESFTVLKKGTGYPVMSEFQLDSLNTTGF